MQKELLNFKWAFRVQNNSKILTICFSEYLFDDSKLTASMCPKSMSCPSRKMNRSLHTYFFFWYPSNVLSPLNLLRIFANSLFMRFTSDSLLLPFVCVCRLDNWNWIEDLWFKMKLEGKKADVKIIWFD